MVGPLWEDHARLRFGLMVHAVRHTGKDTSVTLCGIGGGKVRVTDEPVECPSCKKHMRTAIQ